MLQIQIDYPVVRQLLLYGNGHTLVSSPRDAGAARLDAPSYHFAGQFANAFQERILDEGEYKALFPFFDKAEYETRYIDIVFKAQKKIAYKEISLQFFYFLQKRERGTHIYVPVLNITGFTAEEEEIEKAVEELIRMDFIRKERLEHLQEIISTIWLELQPIENVPITLNTYRLAELERLKTEKSRKLLPSVAQKMSDTLAFSKQMLFGSDQYVRRLGEILRGQYNRSTLLVGKSGVGKTTIVWEAVRLQKKLGFSQEVWETTASTLIKELTQGTGWQQGLSVIAKELRNQGDVLFLRNLMELFEVGQYEGNSVSMALFLREFVARGEITLVSECSDEELAYIDRVYPNYSNLFNIIRIEEPTGEELRGVILEKIQSVAGARKLNITDEAVLETIRLHKRYMPYTGFPGRPIRFLENILINAQTLAKIGAAEGKLERAGVIRAFCTETGMPEFVVNPEVEMRLPDVEVFFRKNVFGQDHAVSSLVDLLASVKATVLRQGKPIASLLFVGPTGVGKTEMAKVLAEFMFGSRDKMIRFDMSEFSDPYAVGRLIGESYFSDGLLTSAVRREPFCVLLFDELEKATPDFSDLLLQMLGEGRLSDSQGKLVNFCSTIIIMTSNIGAKKLQWSNLGWDTERTREEIAEFFETEVRKHFRPEIFNRIDQILPFFPLDKTHIRRVVEREIRQFQMREGILTRKLDWQCSDEVYNYLAEKGHHPQYGARALQRALREELIVPLAQLLNQYPTDEKIILNIDLHDDTLTVSVDNDPLKLDLMIEELTQSEFTDYACELCNHINNLFESGHFNKLKSDISELERQEKQQPKEFWQDARQPRKLAYFQSLSQRLHKAAEAMNALEMDMALVSLGIKGMNTHLYETIKAWDADYLQLKVELIAQLYPENNITRLGLYGKDIERVFEFYQRLCKEQNYTFVARAVWYRPSYYNEQITKTELEEENRKQDKEANLADFEEEDILDLSDEEKEAGKEKVKRRKYLYVAYKEGERYDKSAQKEDIFVGLELQIMSYCVDLYFRHEAGLQEVSRSEEDKKFAKVFVAKLDEGLRNTPQDIHAVEGAYWRGKPRRRFYAQSIEDSEYGIAKRRALRNEDKDEQYLLLKKQIDARYRSAIEATLRD